ncbi:MAG TPA: PilW family protein [Rhodocyclaceae bacterium]|nr:PilW family protein [Rhodocyclaceae bacterium]
MKMNPGHPAQSGFTIVELLVGMLIGIITAVVIGQVMALSEGQKRTATSGSDTQVNGALALYAIERDAKNAGYGMTSVSSGGIGCEVHMKNGANPVSNFTMVPAVVTDGTGGAPDTLRFMASSKTGITLPTRISIDHPETASNFFVDSDVGIQDNDMMIAVPAAGCSGTKWATVFQVTNDPNPGGGGGGGGGQGQNKVIHNSGQSDWNQPGGQTILPAGGYTAGDYLINLGTLLDHTYSVSANNLTLTEFSMATNSTASRDLYPQIVQIQAVYGKDDGATGTADDGIIDTWNATTPATNDGAAWRRIRAIRVALVARSPILEKETVTTDGAAGTTTCDSATPAPSSICWKPNPGGNGVKIDVNIGNANPDWQRYRYRVYETTIPLRNVIWQQ